jgi:hypothetical protein
MANKGRNKTKMRRKRRMKSDGFKRRKVIATRKKLRKRWASDKCHDDDGFVPSHIIKRHEGRKIRKEKRLSANRPTLKAV